MYDIEQWEKAAAFHGHKCGGLAIGFKAVEALKNHIQANSAKDEEIVCVTENDACGVDAIQALLGCTIGKGNLIYKPLGKMAFSFYFRESGESLRIYFKGNKENIPHDDWMDYILAAPCEDIFSFGKPLFGLPERARIFNSVECSECGEKSREDKIRLKDGKMVCLSCFNEYDR